MTTLEQRRRRQWSIWGKGMCVRGVPLCVVVSTQTKLSRWPCYLRSRCFIFCDFSCSFIFYKVIMPQTGKRGLKRSRRERLSEARLHKGRKISLYESVCFSFSAFDITWLTCIHTPSPISNTVPITESYTRGACDWGGGGRLSADVSGSRVPSSALRAQLMDIDIG